MEGREEILWNFRGREKVLNMTGITYVSNTGYTTMGLTHDLHTTSVGALPVQNLYISDI